MRCAISLLIANIVLIAANRSVNYCGSKMCGHTNAHTFCQYPPGPSPSCRGYMDAHLTSEEKVRIVARLNRRRSEAADGALKRFSTAGNMLKWNLKNRKHVFLPIMMLMHYRAKLTPLLTGELARTLTELGQQMLGLRKKLKKGKLVFLSISKRWVEELAREAQRWADQCRPPRTPDERDTCRDLYATTVGQCVASVVGEAPGLRVESMVDLWYMQSKLYKGNVSYYAVPMTNVSYYGDFAQMIWARSYMVGCGRSRFMSDWNGRLRSVERLVCNIAPRGPTPGTALWAPAIPTSVCPPRSIPDPDLITLCNYQRELDALSDVDGAMSLEEHVLLSIVLEIENKEVLNYQGSLDELYMTKLAVVTMDSRVTTVSYYSPVHKRDILETLGLDENIVHINNVIVESDIDDFMNATKIVVRIEQSTDDYPRSITKKANLIGRPKSYNIEELNDDGISNVQEDNNQLEDIPRPDLSKIDPDVYLEYAILDNQENKQEDNITSEYTSTSSAMPLENQSKIYNNIITVPQENTLLTEYLPKITVIPVKGTDYSRIAPNDVTTNNTTAAPHDYFVNASNSMNTSTEVNDDYLTDPETVRELQEALDRYERSYEETRPTAGKVRRELRGRNLLEPVPDNENEDTSQEDDSAQISEEIEKRSNLNPGRQEISNLTNKTPMLNMVLKYLPYLKPYQKEILGAATSSGYRFVVSYVIFSFDVVLTCF